MQNTSLRTMLISSKTSDAFLALVRIGIGHGNSVSPEDVDWSAIKALAEQHGLSAIVLDGVKGLNINHPNLITSLDQDMRLEWIGEIMRDYEQLYDFYRRAISDFARWHNEHGYKMMVLKGYACALDWPKPEHRPCGDIDIWQFGRQKEADEVLLNENDNHNDNRIEMDNSHHHHTVFEWKGFTVENHYDFLNVHHHKSNVELEAILKDLGRDDTHSVELLGEKVYLPSPNLHALFLLRHSMSNFASTGFQLRQLLDWGFFVEKHGKEVDWEWLEVVIDEYGMKSLYQIFNAICVADLGFEPALFQNIQIEPELKERVLNDILSPEFSEIETGGFLRRAFYKYRRWKANAWKHELCFNESMWSAFWSGIWGHLLKPKSI